MKRYSCPICRCSVQWENNPWRPFCSERCKLIDLGAWSGENYLISDKPEIENDEIWSEIAPDI
ncbi:MAG: DNA gyrase inhibitor YacG [Holophagales bacterium]|nr:DNA gyrase inhibitor YacG [Holophagales bacterium]